MPDVLEKILEARRRSVQLAKASISIDELDRMIAKVSSPLNFREALAPIKKEIAIIAEMKKKSPSEGPIRSNYEVTQIAEAYQRGGASALSVLTEPDFFGGELEDLKKVKELSQIPILRKDFIFDGYQIAEARRAGADAALLIADMLDPHQLKELVACALEYKLEPLVEVFSPDVIDSALMSGAICLGINTRNLRTLEMIPDNVTKLSILIPKDRILVAESGIKGPDDLKHFKAMGVSAALVGTSLLKQNNLEAAVRSLVEAS